MNERRPSLDRPLAALYYPYADVLASQSLLEACLLFDIVYVFEPNFFRAPTGGSASVTLPHGPEMAALVDAEVVQPIGPRLLDVAPDPFSGPETRSGEHMVAIQGLIARDRKDVSLSQLCSSYGAVSWEIPTGQQLYWNGLGLLLNDANTDVRVFANRVDFYSLFMERVGLRHVLVEPWVERRLRTSGDLLVRVPFREAESLMIALTITACSELDLDPITDSRFHSEFLMRKLRSMQSNPEVAEILSGVAKPMKSGALGLESVRVSLPQLDGLTPESVLALRKRCSSSLGQFRAHLRTLRYEIESQPWASSFSDELERIVQARIIPVVNDLESDLRSQSRLLGIKSLSSIITAVPLPLVLTFASGLPAWIALAIGAGTAAANEAAQYWVERQKYRRHGLYFLLDGRP
jgi:hypothetical protein